jgi:tRNA U38,U39,U40 pseudouridine synthase TruA
LAGDRFESDQGHKQDLTKVVFGFTPLLQANILILSLTRYNASLSAVTMEVKRVYRYCYRDPDVDPAPKRHEYQGSILGG